MINYTLQRGMPVSADVNPNEWFDVQHTSSWIPEYTQLVAFASVAVKNDAPRGLLIRSISIDAVTMSHQKPVRACVNVWGQPQANCQVHDHNYSKEQTPGQGRSVLEVEFEGSYIGTAHWKHDFDYR